MTSLRLTPLQRRIATKMVQDDGFGCTTFWAHWADMPVKQGYPVLAGFARRGLVEKKPSGPMWRITAAGKIEFREALNA